MLINVLESQPTFSWCVPPPSAFCPLKHVESRGLRSSCSFFWRLHPSLLELCNSRGFRIEERSSYVKLNPLKSPINMISVYILEVSLIERWILLPLSACLQWPLLWNGTEETVLRSFHYPFELEPAGHKDNCWTPNCMINGWKPSDIRNVCCASHALVCSPWIWCPSWSPVHIPDRRWRCLSTSSWEWFVSRWSRSHSEPPLLSLCGLSWRWEVLLQRKGNHIHPFMTRICKEENVFTNCFQKLLILFLGLQLVFSSESHVGKAQRMTQEKTLWLEIRSGQLQLRLTPTSSASC